MQGRRDTIIERRQSGTLHVRVITGDRTDRVSETIAAIPGVVEDAVRSGLREVVLDVTCVDNASGPELLPTVVLACRKAVGAGLGFRVVAGDQLRASASVAGLSEALSID